MKYGRPLALFAAFAAAGALAYGALRYGPARGPLSAVPAASFLVASIDVNALRSSALASAVFDKDAPWGLGELARSCGFDPLSRIRELDLAVPEGGDSGDFGLAASADVTREELVRCAESALDARGHSHAVTRAGAFYLVEDGKGHALAAKDGGLIVVGQAPFVRAMVDAAEGHAPDLRANREHVSLRAALERGDTRPLAVVTMLLPKELRDRIGREMSEASGDPMNDAVTGVLGVSAAGASLRETPGGMLEARMELRCDSAAACDKTRTLLLKKRLELSQELGLRFVGLGPAIDAFDVTVEGPSLTATTRVRAESLGAAIERVQKMRGRPSRMAPSPLPTPPRPPLPSNETIRPGKDAEAGSSDTTRPH